MDHSREIAALRRKAKRVGRIINPPTLSMPVYFEGEEAPKANKWCMPIMIEASRA